MDQDVSPNPGPKDSAAVGGSAPADLGAGDLRMQRIAEQRAAGLPDLELVRANVNQFTCDLMEFGCQMQRAIADDLANGSGSREHWDEIQPNIDDYLRVVRQMERLAQLDSRLDMRLRAAGAMAARPAFGPPALARKS